jgi:FKBP-type peptidyl-prolyl cis-trans isomerase (trigger factor)
MTSASSKSPIGGLRSPEPRGKTVKFRAVVKGGPPQRPYQLNDEFAKDLGDFKTLDELKETIRKSIFGSASIA